MKRLFRKKKPYITVLDIGTSKICGFMAHVQSNGKVSIIGTGFMPAKGIKSGTIVDLDKATECIGAVLMQIEKQADKEIETVTVNVSSGQLKSRHLVKTVPIADGHPITASDVRHLVDGMIAQGVPAEEEVLHAFPLSYTIDKEQGVAEPWGLYANQLKAHVHVVTIPETQLRNLVMVLDRCHVEIDKKVATPYAMGLACLLDEEKKVGATVVDMGAGTTSFASFMDGGLVHLGLVPFGGNHLTRDIAQVLSTSLTSAERLKILNGAAFLSPKDELERIIVPIIGEEEETNIHRPRSDLIKIIVPRLEDIFEKILVLLSEKEVFQVAARRIVLSGGTASLQGIKEKTESFLQGNVRLAKLPQIKNLPNQFDSYTFMVCIGLLEYVLSSFDYKVAEKFEKPIQKTTRLGKVLKWLVK